MKLYAEKYVVFIKNYGSRNKRFGNLETEIKISRTVRQFVVFINATLLRITGYSVECVLLGT